MSAPDSRRLRFGVFEIDLASGELLKSGIKIKLQDQPFQVLSALLDRPGEVVTREHLRQKIWQADTFVDFDQSLNKAINKIREALGDSPESPKFVETLPRRGYRFVAPVNGHEAPPAPLVTNSRLPRLFWAALVFATLATAATTVVFWSRSSPQPQIVRSVQLTNDGHAKLRRVVSDGARLYFPEQINGRFTIAQVEISGGNTQAIPISFPDTGNEVDGLLDISANGELLITSHDPDHPNYRLWRMRILDGSLRRVGDLRPDDATFSPDGQHIYFGTDHSLYVAGIDGLGEKKLATMSSGTPINFCWSADGRRLRFTVFDEKTGDTRLWEVLAGGTNLHPVLSSWNIQGGSWTPDGEFFSFRSSGNFWAARRSRTFFEYRDSQPVQLTFGPINYRAGIWSRDGRTIFTMGELRRGELVRYDAGTRSFVTYLGGLSGDGVDFSRDGQWAVYTSYPEGDLWRMRVDGSQRLQLTTGMRTWMPRWSPDGRQIAFMGIVARIGMKVHLVPMDGGTPRQLMSAGHEDGAPNWSPDGSRLLFTPVLAEGTPLSAYTLQVLDLKSGRETTLPGSVGLKSPRWSPDGAYICARGGDSSSLWLFNVREQTWAEIMPEPISYTTWSHNGRYIYFNAGRVPFVIGRVEARTRRIERLASLESVPALGRQGPAWMGLTPDDSPLILRNRSSQEIYALEWRVR
jgi:Tol biopolymer transport system component/DNA-binding winged helix-turn-helix (wHTH) protein